MSAGIAHVASTQKIPQLLRHRSGGRPVEPPGLPVNPPWLDARDLRHAHHGRRGQSPRLTSPIGTSLGHGVLFALVIIATQTTP
jgi:hypothetical protein